MDDLPAHGTEVSFLYRFIKGMVFLLGERLMLEIACFNAATGDIENAPALDALGKFELTEKNGAVYITGDETIIKAGRRKPNIRCLAQGQEKVVVVGG
jgi:hypothetical protein